jgi:hypothetical protein
LKQKTGHQAHYQAATSASSLATTHVSGLVIPKAAKDTIPGIRDIHHMTLTEGEAQLRRITALDEGMIVVKAQRP